MLSRKPLSTPAADSAILSIDTGADSRLVERLQMAGILLFLLGVAIIPSLVILSSWLDHRGMRREWMLAGPACPVAQILSPAFRGAKPPPPFVFKGIAFAHQVGDVDCAAIPEDSIFSSTTFPACHFRAPAAVAVTVDGRTTLFESGVGHGASIMFHHGKLSCVVLAGLRG